MIWVAGRIVPEASLTIPVADRTFEHGLGLIETLRTWQGRPALLDAHRARMLRSADALGLRIDPDTLPDAPAIARLLEAEAAIGDRMLRITATGGAADGAPSVVWMRSGPLPPPARDGGIAVATGTWEVAAGDPIARHKTLNYWSRRVAYERARAQGFDEVLAMTPGPSYWEGSRSNLFAVRCDCLLVPSLDGPIVPGIMRRLVLDLARGLPWEVREVGGIAATDLLGAEEVFLTNSVRGIVPVARTDGRSWPAPGPWTRRLQALVAGRLREGGPAS